jgi:predicted enzyme related to lactoylglutathione lyase
MAATTDADVPQLFRLSVEVDDLDRAIDFYTRLLGVEGRGQAGARTYFDCGSVTISVLDVSSSGAPHPAPKVLYFTVKNLDAVHERATALGCLSADVVHDAPAGAIAVRP